MQRVEHEVLALVGARMTFRAQDERRAATIPTNTQVMANLFMELPAPEAGYALPPPTGPG
jgi:hypothetical protein